MEIAVLGLGCFWGPEKKFSKIEGIVETEVGYCGEKCLIQLTKMYVQEKQIMPRLLS